MKKYKIIMECGYDRAEIKHKQTPVRLNPGLFNTTRMEPNTTTLAAAMEFNGVVLRSTQ